MKLKINFNDDQMQEIKDTIHDGRDDVYENLVHASVVLNVTAKEGVGVPSYAHEGDAGMDLRANEDVWLHPMEIRLVKTGLSMAIPEGFVGDVRPRSGLALKHGITVLNTPGTIDSHYRGEVGVILINLGKKPFAIAKGDRIAQLVVSAVARCDVEVVESLDETDRGEGGFGSTGVK